MKRYEIKQLLKEDVSALLGTTICVKGWVRTKRGNKNVAFLAVIPGRQRRLHHPQHTGGGGPRPL